MAEVAVSHMIFFIASIIVATIVVTSMFAITQDFTDGLEERGHSNADRLRTHITILNDPVAMPYNSSSDELHVYIKNTGSRVVDPNSTTIFIDGFPFVPDSITLLNGTKWTVGLTIDVVVTADIDPGDHSLKATVEYGVYDRMDFRV